MAAFYHAALGKQSAILAAVIGTLRRYATPFGLAMLALLAAWPILRAGPPTVGDGFNHYFRLAELHWAVLNGVYYPRWLPDVAYGFGLPVFNFYPLLTYWLAEVWALVGMSLSSAMQAGYTMAMITLVWGAYAWARTAFRSGVAGLAAATAYSTSPYLFLTIIHRGAYPETWGLAFAPWLFWAMLRLSRNPGIASALLMAVITAGLALSHAVSTLLLLPLALLYLVGLVRSDLRKLLWALLGLGLAVGLSAIFWVPVLLEARFVQLARVGGGMFDYAANFLRLADLFGPPRVFDPLRTFNEVSPGLNWVVLAFALVGVWSSRKDVTVRLLFVGAFLIGMLTLQISQPLWDALPLLPFIQFPWRWVGLLSLLLAMLAGTGIAQIVKSKSRYTAVILPVFVLAAAFYSLAWTFGERPTDLSFVDHADLPAFEISSGQLGTTALGEFVSVWATVLPPPETFASAYESGTLPQQRLDRINLPEGVHILREIPGFNAAEIDYEADAPFDLRFNWLIFPNVSATVNDIKLIAGPEPGSGMLQVRDLPAGRHTLTVRQSLSRPQRIGTGVSVLSLVVVVFLTGREFTRMRTARISARDHKYAAVPARVILTVGGIVLTLLVSRAFWLDIHPSVFHRTRLIGGTVADIPAQDIVFGERIKLIGLDVQDETASLYWQGLAEMSTDYSIALYLQDENGTVLAQQDSQHPGVVPTSYWQPGQYAVDAHVLQPAADTPPGEYHIVVAVYAEEGTLEGIDIAGNVGHYLTVGTLILSDSSSN